MNKFELALMYSENHGMNMWFIGSTELEDDYIGPYLSKEVAQIKLDSLNEGE